MGDRCYICEKRRQFAPEGNTVAVTDDDHYSYRLEDVCAECFLVILRTPVSPTVNVQSVSYYAIIETFKAPEQAEEIIYGLQD